MHTKMNDLHLNVEIKDERIIYPLGIIEQYAYLRFGVILNINPIS